MTAKQKILIVDDNRIIRQLVRLTLASLTEYDLLETDSADQVLPMVLSERPDIIILDVMMPGDLDGFQICRMIKANAELAHCKVILLSARSQADDLQQGKAAGADVYITKPFSPSALVTLIKQFNE